MVSPQFSQRARRTERRLASRSPFPRFVLTTVLAAAFTIVTFVPHARAHGLVHEQIAALTEKLKSQPGNPDLLLRRAELLRDHGDLDAARTDLTAALALAPDHPAPLLALARVERETNHLPLARQAIDAFLAQHPGDAAAFREKALIHTAARDWPEAIDAWDSMLRCEPRPDPEAFLACAQAIQTENPAPHATRRALEVLHRGIEIHPRVIPLRQQAASLCIKIDQIPEAEQHFASLLQVHNTLHPRLLADEGAIWLQHGHQTKAIAAYREAQSAFHALPPSRQAQPGFQSLADTIDQALTTLATK